METRVAAPVIERLSLHFFRNYRDAFARPGAGFNIVSGANAQGKTNLLEAVHLVSTGRLIRGTRDAQAVMHGEETGSVSAELAGSGTTVAVELRRGVRKRVLLNGASLPRPSDVLGRIPTVSFSAGDLEIVRGDPSERRHFLDSELSQLYPGYLRHLAVYKRALEQRNALLKSAQETYQPPDVFEAWEEQLAQHGTEMRRYRRDWISAIAPLVAAAHADLGAGEEVALRYVERDAGDLLENLASGRVDDLRRGTTGTGPHRDELEIEIGGSEARPFGSQGQQRTAVIALKLAVLASASGVLGVPPVLLLDDVFSDLDQGRRSRLVERSLELGGQVFLTCTEPEQAGVELVGRSKVFRVVSGTVTEA
ncbi:MAG: DNA replication/repair protein RecF [Fimbriimonadaceae bacterium]